MGEIVGLFAELDSDGVCSRFIKRSVSQIKCMDYYVLGYWEASFRNFLDRVARDCCGDIGISVWTIYFTGKTDAALFILKYSLWREGE